MELPPASHRIEYTKNKHSRAVCKGDTIVIRLARNLSKNEEADHVQSLLRRMSHLVLRERQKETIDPFRALLDGASCQTLTLASGRKYNVALQPGTRTIACRNNNTWSIEVSPTVRRKQLHRFLWSLISKSDIGAVTQLVHEINDDTFRAAVRSVRLNFATTQWGSCSANGVIMINTALLFLPVHLLHYVIIHELAHRRFANHSAAYWKEVAWALPDYERAYRELRHYRLPQA